MEEHKVQNKYHARDLDPSKLPKGRKPKNQQKKAPHSILAKKMPLERIIWENKYLDFTFKCTKCSVELVMKTDPHNSDYVVEASARRNFEPWHNEDKELDEEKRKREAEEKGDNMKSLGRTEPGFEKRDEHRCCFG
ncbi:unnamed protein product [Prunus armeniaca]